MQTANPTEFLVTDAGGGSCYVRWPIDGRRRPDDVLLQLAIDLQELVTWEPLSVTVDAVAPSACDDLDEFGTAVDGLWLHDPFEAIRQPIRGVLDGVADDIVTAAEGEAFERLWLMSMAAAGPELAVRCLDRGAAGLGERPAGSGDETVTAIAARWGRDEVIERLANAPGHSVNRAGPNGLTPLHVAASHGHPRTATLLIRLGADPFAPDPTGLTPLALARRVCPDAQRPAVEAVLWPLEWPAAAAAAEYRRTAGPPAGDHQRPDH